MNEYGVVQSVTIQHGHFVILDIYFFEVSSYGPVRLCCFRYESCRLLQR